MPKENTEHLGFLQRIERSLAELHTTTKLLLSQTAVLSAETWPLDANGILTRDWRVPFRSVAVASHSADPITVASGDPLQAPPTGVGVVVIDAMKSSVCNIAGRSLTIYGTAGDLVTIQVFSQTQPPAWGS
jgi:hypothetical protein